METLFKDFFQQPLEADWPCIVEISRQRLKQSRRKSSE